jgi:hypothetical protein
LAAEYGQSEWLRGKVSVQSWAYFILKCKCRL